MGKRKKAKQPPAKGRLRPREKQTWRPEVLHAARNALELRFEDIRELTGINEKGIAKIMRGDYNATYRTLESVVSSLFLEMFEVFDPEETIISIVKKVYERANLERKVKEIDGAVVAIKPDYETTDPNNKLILIAGTLDGYSV
jgi:hypothetical protein